MAEYPNSPHNRAAKQLLRDDSMKLAVCEWLGKEVLTKDHITDMGFEFTRFLRSDTFAKHVREQTGRLLDKDALSRHTLVTKTYDTDLVIEGIIDMGAENDESVITRYVELDQFARKCLRAVMTEPVDSSYLAHIGNDIPDAYYDGCVNALDVGISHPERTLSKGSDDWREWRLTSLDPNIEGVDWVPPNPQLTYTLYQQGEEIPGVRICIDDDHGDLKHIFNWVYQERPDGPDGDEEYETVTYDLIDKGAESTADYTNQVKQFMGEVDVLVDKFLDYDDPDEHGHAIVR